MSRLRFTPLAVRDLEEIHDFLAENSAGAALRLVERLENRCRSLAENPGMGRRREELPPALRSLPESGYVIFYRPIEEAEGGGVEVVRVLHGARDIERLFHETDDEDAAH